MDGSGYPEGLSGQSIPLLARILAVADAFDAMTTDRPYRSRMAVERAIDILRAEVDQGKLDPEVVRALTTMVRTEGRENGTVTSLVDGNTPL
jgi:HD-GYP domain-containing protein (c-di-GMP phosphodiesterase class II)